MPLESITGLPSSSAAQNYLQVLPGYMLPTAWMALDAMPLNGNGKADRPRIQRLFQERAISAKAV